jgi:hypothetical protein
MTGKFKVEPNALDTLSGKLKKLADDNAQVGSYIKEWLDVKGDVGGIFPQIASAIQQIRADLEPNYTTLGQLTADSATELTKAAQVYRTTDRARAEELDRTRSLTRALRVLADTTSDPVLKQQVGAVLSGRGSVRDFARSEAYNQLLDRVMPAAMQKYSEMSEEERNRLAEQG